MNYAIRITTPYEAFQPCVESFAKACDRLVIYEHTADASVSRTHIHIGAYGCSVSTDTLKNYVKKALGVVSKSDWSFKTTYGQEAKKVDENLITYMSKGHLKPSYNKGIGEDRLATLAGEWKGVKEYKQEKLLHGAGSARAREEKRKTVYELQEECAKRIDTNNIVMDEDILEVITDVMKRERHRTHMYDMLNWFDNVRFLSEKHGARFKGEVLDKIQARRRI